MPVHQEVFLHDGDSHDDGGGDDGIDHDSTGGDGRRGQCCWG